MGKRFDMMLFPGFRRKAFTLSYDDGVIQDRRLVEMLNRYQVKGTFNLGYGVLGHKEIVGPENGRLDISKIDREEVRSLYQGQEVGGHGLYHSDLTSISVPYAMYEITEDKANLERLAGYPLKTFAYPFGLFNQQVKELLKSAGYHLARTIRSSHGFDIPDDLLEFDPTCHHNDPQLMELAERFVKGKAFRSQLFYVWGHGYEFDKDDNWDVMEKLLECVAGHQDEIWYATNGEITDYIRAYKMLEYSMDGSMIYNPSATDVCIMTAFGHQELIKAGAVTEIGDTPL